MDAEANEGCSEVSVRSELECMTLLSSESKQTLQRTGAETTATFGMSGAAEGSAGSGNSIELKPGILILRFMNKEHRLPAVPACAHIPIGCEWQVEMFWQGLHSLVDPAK